MYDDFGLLQTNGKSENSASTREEAHYILYVFFSLSSKVYIISIKIPNKGLESFRFCVDQR